MYSAAGESSEDSIIPEFVQRVVETRHALSLPEPTEPEHINLKPDWKQMNFAGFWSWRTGDRASGTAFPARCRGTSKKYWIGVWKKN